MDDVWIFANPIAGRGLGRRLAHRLHHRLTHEKFTPHLFFDPADTIPDDLLKNMKDVRAAIIIGGDGTLRTVAGRLYRDHLAHASSTTDNGPRTTAPLHPSSFVLHPYPPPPLLIVPLGTANLMGRHLGIHWARVNAEDKLITALRERRTVAMDAAMANGRLFLLVAGVGIDAHIVHELDRIRRGPIRYASYAIPAALALAHYDYPPLTVTVDDRVVFRDQPAMAFVGNIPEYGTGFPLLPHARPDDGLLDVCVTPCASAKEVAGLFLQAAAGEHLDAKGVVYVKGRRIRIESTHNVPVQIDGEAAGHTPLDIRMLPWRIEFIAPPGAAITSSHATPLARAAKFVLSQASPMIKRGRALSKRMGRRSEP